LENERVKETAHGRQDKNKEGDNSSLLVPERSADLESLNLLPAFPKMRESTISYGTRV